MGNGVQFGKIPYPVIDSGVIASLKGSEAKVYLVILAHMQSSDWTSRLSQERISRLTGLRRPTVVKAVAGLSRAGLLRITRGCGRGITNVYRINSHPDVTYSEPRIQAKQSPGSDPFKAENRQLGGEKQSSMVLETVSNDTQNSHLGVTPTEGTDSNISEQMLTAADSKKVPEQSRAVLDTLNNHGIGAPTDQKLVREFPDITTALITEALVGASTSAGPGCRVELIRKRMPGLIDREADQTQKRVAMTKRLSKIETYMAAEYRAKHTEIDEIISGLDPDELKECRDLVRRRLSVTLGGGSEARSVVATWITGCPALSENEAFRWMLREAKRMHDKEAQQVQERQEKAAQTTRYQDEEKKARQKKTEDSYRQRKLATEWVNGLDDQAIRDVFICIVMESPNQAFRNKHQNGDTPPATEIRRRFLHELTAYFIRHKCDASRIGSYSSTLQQTTGQCNST